MVAGVVVVCGLLCVVVVCVFILPSLKFSKNINKYFLCCCTIYFVHNKLIHEFVY